MAFWGAFFYPRGRGISDFSQGFFGPHNTKNGGGAVCEMEILNPKIRVPFILYRKAGYYCTGNGSLAEGPTIYY
jgi:hypothetical protein